MFEITSGHEGFGVLVATEDDAKIVCERLNKVLAENNIEGSFEYMPQDIRSIEAAINELLPMCEDSCYFEERIFI